MQKWLVAAVVAGLLLSCSSTQQAAGDNTLTREQKNEGWKLLFNGQTTRGWHRYGGGSIDSVWKVNDGMLWLDTKNKKALDIRGDWDIVTDEEYDNFHFQVEWKISRAGNSGIIFYIHEDKQKHNWPWETGPEMQVLDNELHPDAKFPKHRAGDLYDIIACSQEVARPVGEWNLAEIKSVNGKLDLYLNGVNVISTTLWDASWKSLVAGSKFRNMAGFGTYRKGRIGLQDHGDDVFYRNIKIRRL
jgi:Domain of Unknown Function (DUF1080).